MKKLLFGFLFLFSAVVASYAQTDSTGDELKTLFGHKPHSNGFYVGLSGGYTQIDSRDAFTTGFRAGWIIDHGFAVGLAAGGFSNDLYVGHSSGSNYSSLQGGYGGLLLQPIVLPRYPVHVSFPVLLGAGGAMSLQTHYYEPYEADWNIQDEAFYLIAEPAVEVELNLVKWIRFSVGASYRFTSPLSLQGYSSDELHGFSANATLSFGKF